MIGARETTQLLLAILGGSTRRAGESITVLTSLIRLNRQGKVMFGDERVAREIAAGVPERQAAAALEGILHQLAQNSSNLPYLQFIAVEQVHDAYQMLVRFQKDRTASEIRFGALPPDYQHGLITIRRISSGALKKIARALGRDEEIAT